MIKVLQFRLFPSKSQLSAIKSQLETHCKLYNECLEYKKTLWETEHKNVTCNDLIVMKVPLYKGLSNYSALQQTVRRLGKSYQAFFRQNSSFPRFKNVSRFRTIQFSKIGDGCKVLDNSIYIQNVGVIPGNFHREMFGKPKTLLITLRNNKLYVSILFDEKSGVKASRDINKSVGIDFGIKSIITTSDGDKFVSPTFTKDKLKDIQRLHRRKNYKALNKVYEKITNRRKDFNHKLSKEIVSKYDIIALEELKVESITSDYSNVNRRLYDVGICQLINFITYKAENAGKLVIMIDPAYTTQTCTKCGNIVKKELSERTHNCQKCGLKIDRDVNAAINIARAGLSSLGVSP